MSAFPVLLVTAGHGQNAFLTASCFAWAAVLLPRRHGLAGVCLGLLAVKPHLTLAVRVALLAARRWTALAGAAVSAAARAGWAEAHRTSADT